MKNNIEYILWALFFVVIGIIVMLNTAPIDYVVGTVLITMGITIFFEYFVSK